MLAFVCHTAKERKHKQAFYGDVGRYSCFYDTVLCRYFLRLSHLADAVVGLAACCGVDVHLFCVQNKSCVCHFCGCLAYFIIFAVPAWVSYFINVYECAD